MQFNTCKDKSTKPKKGSRIFQIYCSKCGSEVCVYQKEGAGNLLRIFLNKIISPNNMVEMFKTIKTKRDLHGLKCPSCGELIGVPMIYDKDNRLAFRLIPNKIIKKEI